MTMMMIMKITIIIVFFFVIIVVIIAVAGTRKNFYQIQAFILKLSSLKLIWPLKIKLKSKYILG